MADGKELNLPEPENGFWALVELFGHQRIAGFVSEYQFGGETFVRVDVPQVDSTPTFTKLYGKGAIYAISPLVEPLARRLAESLSAAPLRAYELPQIAAQPAAKCLGNDPDECDDPECPVHGEDGA